MLRWLTAVALLGCASACAGQAPAPTAVATRAPTAVPTATPIPAVAPTATAATVASLAEDSSDVAATLLNEVSDIVDEASAMSEASCDELKQALKDNPNVFRSVRGFAATIKRVAAQQPDVMADPQVQDAIKELDTTMGELDGALGLCGIPST